MRHPAPTIELGSIRIARMGDMLGDIRVRLRCSEQVDALDDHLRAYERCTEHDDTVPAAEAQ